ncbi:MAG TPA: hypothetical protein VFE23_06740 [Usitatibacter sp.]|jgi:hypothetical protein|nr:hypothetical protein [Usitatibacter sp.]
MNKIHAALAIACLSASMLAGCARTSAIYNVNEAPVATASGKAMSAAQVRSAIMTAGAALGWRFADAGPGKLEGTLNIRAHQAVVLVPYTAKTYSIVYKSSQNLNEANGSIHSNYNGWVQNLDNAIRAEMSRS